jgi:hypothetical protein
MQISEARDYYDEFAVSGHSIFCKQAVAMPQSTYDT